jgi:hypothetical protein
VKFEERERGEGKNKNKQFSRLISQDLKAGI